jgi:23S rRNA pseudouridine2605 synthase
MLAAVGHPVIRLHRSRYGPLDLRALAAGEWRELTGEEVAALRDTARR